MNNDTDELQALRPFTLKQSLSWAKHACTSETVQHLRSRAVVARLVEEIETLQALLNNIRIELGPGHNAFLIDTYFAELDKS